MDIRSWQEEVADVVRQEMEIEGAQYPLDPVRIDIIVTVDGEEQLKKLGDPDNIEKVIFDALTGVVIRDDKLKNIPIHMTRVEVGRREGTDIVITPLQDRAS
jgi:Holliday junction resolvase RusA-like endonuclease